MQYLLCVLPWNAFATKSSFETKFVESSESVKQLNEEVDSDRSIAETGWL